MSGDILESPRRRQTASRPNAAGADAEHQGGASFRDHGERLEMKRAEGGHHSHGQTWHGGEDDAGDDGLGLQGAALILELQRLRHAIDAERADLAKARGTAHQQPERSPRRRAAPPKHSSRKKLRKKSRVGQAVDLCLKPFRSKASEATSRPDETTDRAAAPPRHRRSPSIAPEQPIPLNFAKLN